MAQYDKLASVYDEMMGESGDIPHQYLIDSSLKKLLPNIPDGIVLDIGCGNGYWAKFLASHYAKVIAIDNSRKLLEIARSKRTAPNISYKLMDAGKLTLPDNYFDLVFSSMVFHYLQDIESVARSIYRKLRSDGYLLISESNPIYDKIKNPFLRICKSRTRYITTTLSGNAELIVYYEPLELIIKHFTDAGFNLLKLAEPRIDQKIIDLYPGYTGLAGIPRAAIMLFRKGDK